MLPSGPTHFGNFSRTTNHTFREYKVCRQPVITLGRPLLDLRLNKKMRTPFRRLARRGLPPRKLLQVKKVRPVRETVSAAVIQAAIN